MKCNNCGKDVPQDSKFCPQCGHQVSERPIWEYKVERIDLRTDKAKIIDERDLVDKLNKRGEQGWQLTTALLASYELDRRFWGNVGVRQETWLFIFRRLAGI